MAQTALPYNPSETPGLSPATQPSSAQTSQAQPSSRAQPNSRGPWSRAQPNPRGPWWTQPKRAVVRGGDQQQQEHQHAAPSTNNTPPSPPRSHFHLQLPRSTGQYQASNTRPPISRIQHLSPYSRHPTASTEHPAFHIHQAELGWVAGLRLTLHLLVPRTRAHEFHSFCPWT